MKLSVSVMAHPARAGLVDSLLESLGAAPGEAPVAWDDEGPPRRDPDRLWRTARRAWQLYDPTADWHLLLQDDAAPCDGFLEVLAAGLKHVPERAIVSAYIGSVRPMPGMWRGYAERADRELASWIVGRRSAWGVALAVPTALVPEMIDWCDRQHGIPDDMRVGRWAHRKRLEVWFPWPSLVDHAEEVSLLGHGPGRRALRFAGDGASTWDPAGLVIR